MSIYLKLDFKYFNIKFYISVVNIEFSPLCTIELTIMSLVPVEWAIGNSAILKGKLNFWQPEVYKSQAEDYSPLEKK